MVKKQLADEIVMILDTASYWICARFNEMQMRCKKQSESTKVELVSQKASCDGM